MPTRDEQFQYVEAALRQRFFQYVPKVERPDRANWTEAQHDQDRLSRALGAYALVGLCDLDDLTAARAITDGRDDGGIDALYFDKGSNKLFFIQSKFKIGGAAPAQDENLKTINGIKALQARRFNEFNEAFRNRLDEIEEALDTPGIQFVLVLTFLGENLGSHVVNDLNALKAELNQISNRMDWKPAGLNLVHGWLSAEQMSQAVTAEITLENWIAIPAPRKVVYGQISAADLGALVIEKGKPLFERNIRHYLGSVGVNTAIETTVKEKPADFFFLNNGITAVVESLIPGGGNNNRCVFGLNKISIVNGAQTAGAIANAASDGEISPDAKILITLIEIGDDSDDFGSRITRARNHQNVVRNVDFAALDPNQERLRREMAVVGITYHYRPSADALEKRNDSITLQEAAMALACLAFPTLTSDEVRRIETQGHPVHNAVEHAVIAKKEIGRFWDQGGPLYGRLFPPTLTGLKLCRLVRIYRFIDRILSGSERSENGYYRRMFFRHARYFIMIFVAYQSEDVLLRTAFEISIDDQTLLSTRTNEIAEVIYAQTEPLQGVKGYLSLFRNMTDSQPLADNIVHRLRQREAQAQLVGPNPSSQSPSPTGNA